MITQALHNFTVTTCYKCGSITCKNHQSLLQNYTIGKVMVRLHHKLPEIALLLGMQRWPTSVPNNTWEYMRKSAFVDIKVLLAVINKIPVYVAFLNIWLRVQGQLDHCLRKKYVYDIDDLLFTAILVMPLAFFPPHKVDLSPQTTLIMCVMNYVKQ